MHILQSKNNVQTQREARERLQRRMNNLQGGSAYNNRSNILTGGGRPAMNNLDGPANMGGAQPYIVQNFKNAIGQSKWYQITITNVAVTPLSFYITPGLQYRLPTGPYLLGLMATGAFKSISNADGLSGAGSPTTIEFFNDYVQKVPGTLSGFKFSSPDATTLTNVLMIQPQTPFGVAANNPISLSNFKDEYSYNANIVTLPQAVQFDNQTAASFTVNASTSVSISFFYNEFANLAGAMSQASGNPNGN